MALHPLIQYILYAKNKPSWDAIKDACVLDERGEIDVKWFNALDNDQHTRMDIAAFIQDLLDKQILTYNPPRQVISYHKKND